MKWIGIFITTFIFIKILTTSDIVKRIWEGISTSKKDLKVNWKKLKKAERNLKYGRNSR